MVATSRHGLFSLVGGDESLLSCDDLQKVYCVNPEESVGRALMVEAEVKCSLTHQRIAIIFWKQIEGAFSRACEMFSAVKILICWPDRAIALAWCVQQRLATGCLGLAVFISSRALSLNYSYN